MPEAQKEFLTSDDPFALFHHWLSEAEQSEINDPNAMSLATVDASGLPDVRMVLLKDVDDKGFVFYTNQESAKGTQLANQPKAALCLHWKSLRRQVRARGVVSEASIEEADAYFASRSRDSQIGAWSSQQSRAFKGNDDLREAVEENKNKFEGKDVPRPPHWKGFMITPLEIEFWHDQPFRLHDRLVFRRSSPEEKWTTERLFP